MISSYIGLTFLLSSVNICEDFWKLMDGKTVPALSHHQIKGHYLSSLNYPIHLEISQMWPLVWFFAAINSYVDEIEISAIQLSNKKTHILCSDKYWVGDILAVNELVNLNFILVLMRVSINLSLITTLNDWWVLGN